jgi:ankyrin repeat protein
VNELDARGLTAVHHAAGRGDNDLILYLVSKGADVTIVGKNGETVADMANGPRQRIQPFAETIALVEILGSKNSHKCVSC